MSPLLLTAAIVLQARGLLLACEPAAAPPPPPPPVEAPAPTTPPEQRVREALGSPELPRAVMDAFAPELLGLRPPPEIARTLAAFAEAWGAAALRTEGGRATGPRGEDLEVELRRQDGRIATWVVRDQGRVVLELSEVAARWAPPRAPEEARPTLARGEEGGPRVEVRNIAYKGERDALAFERALDAVLDGVAACAAASKEPIRGSMRVRIEPDGVVHHQGKVLDLGLDRCVRSALGGMALGEGGAVELDLAFE